jgi:hypothetical protein
VRWLIRCKDGKLVEDWKMGDYSIGDKSTVAEHKK